MPSLQITFRKDHEMLNPDENYDLGYDPSGSSADQTDRSIHSNDSFAYSRTNSEVSAFTEHTDDTDVASPYSWQGLKSPARLALSRLGMRQQKDGLDGEIMELGEFLSLFFIQLA